MLNIQAQHKFKYAHQQILFFKLLFNVKLIYSIQVLGPWLWGNRSFFFFSGGAEEGASGENAPPVHGIKNTLGEQRTRKEKRPLPRSDTSSVHDRGQVSGWHGETARFSKQ